MRCDDCGKTLRKDDVGLDMKLGTGKKLVLCVKCTDNFLAKLVPMAMPYFIDEWKKRRG